MKNSGGRTIESSEVNLDSGYCSKAVAVEVKL